MEHCKIVESKTFYQATEQIKIESPIFGLICSDHKDITIVPQIVRSGENRVIAIRNTKLVSVEVGEVVGVILPLDDESVSAVAPEQLPEDPPAESPKNPEQTPEGSPEKSPVEIPQEPPKPKATQKDDK